MVIDVEHHLTPPAIWQRQGGKPGQSVMIRSADGKKIMPLDDATWDINIHLQHMDAAGIDMAVLSGAAVLSLEDARAFNDHFAGLVRQHPRRLAAMASTVPLGGKPALAELERAIKDLGLKGVIMSAQVGTHPIDSKELWPFYEKVCALNIPLFIHISLAAPGFDACNAPYDMNRTIVREFELAQATVRLCAGGILEDFPDLKCIVAHYGGGISSIKERMESFIRRAGAGFWDGKPLISEPYLERFNQHFNRLYFTMAGREVGMQTVHCALTNISPERLLFATDYPPIFNNDPAGMKAFIAKINQLDLDRRTIDAMLGTNSAQLFGLDI